MFSSSLHKSDGITPLPGYYVSINPSAVTTDFDYPTMAALNSSCPQAILEQIPGAECALTDINGFFIIVYRANVGSSVTGGTLSIQLGLFDDSGVKQGDIEFNTGYGGGDSCSSTAATFTPAAGATVELGPVEVTTSCNLTPPGTIFVIVYNADQASPVSDLIAQDPWAVTTLYETPGYEGERVRLTPLDAGKSIYGGNLPVTDGGVRTVLIFDDIFTQPVPFGGDDASPGDGRSNNHKLIVTDDYFSPCRGIGVLGSGFLKDLVQFTGASPPAIPQFFTGGVTITTSLEFEPYIAIPGQSAGSQIVVNFMDFLSPTVDFCSCTTPVNLMVWTGVNTVTPAYSLNPYAGYFTDTNLEIPGGACVPRAQ